MANKLTLDTTSFIQPGYRFMCTGRAIKITKIIEFTEAVNLAFAVNFSVCSELP